MLLCVHLNCIYVFQDKGYTSYPRTCRENSNMHRWSGSSPYFYMRLRSIQSFNYSHNIEIQLPFIFGMRIKYAIYIYVCAIFAS